MCELETTNAGVHATRRTLLRGGLALAAFQGLNLAASGRASSATRPAREGEDDATERVRAFFADWGARTAALVASDAPNEDAHLFALSAGLAELDPRSFPEREKETYSENGLSIGAVFGEPSFFVLDIRLEPGAVIRPHNHVGYAFVSMGAAGEVRARHFEHADDVPAPDEKGVDFEVVEVQSGLLLPGRSSSLTRTRANIHTFEAGAAGARMYDFGVHFAEPGEGPTAFSMLEIDPEAKDASRRAHIARWVDPS